MKRQPLTHDQMNAQNWRYKKKIPPVDEFADLNGPVRVTKPTSLPHPLKCSRCEYIATGKADFNDHWSLEH